MSDTPRTDALLASRTEPITAVKEFMRTLERELNECIETLQHIAHRQIVTTLDAVVVKDMAFRRLQKIGVEK